MTSRRRTDIAWCSQSYALYRVDDGGQNITFGMECAHVPGRSSRRRGECGPAAFRLERCSTIGVALFRRPAVSAWRWAVLVRDPLLLLVRRPLSNLDANPRRGCGWRSSGCNQRIGATIVMLRMTPDEAMTMATRNCCHASRERYRNLADPDTVYRYPAMLFVARFMGWRANEYDARRGLGGRTMARAGGRDRVGGGRTRVAFASRDTTAAGGFFAAARCLSWDRPECIGRGEPQLFGRRCGRAHRHSWRPLR